jgi:hypothetical protein
MGALRLDWTLGLGLGALVLNRVGRAQDGEAKHVLGQ